MLSKEEVLKKYFGYDNFRNGQAELIESILHGRSAVAVMPTGAGKSLCYQIPALMLSGLTVVVSPLISLMKDQVANLEKQKIKAVYLSSNLSKEEYGKAIYAVRNNKCNLLYVAPERFNNTLFRAFLEEQKLALVVIDEAHCLVKWGESFRPAYLEVSKFLQTLNKKPQIAAFTATATLEIKKAISEELLLENPYELVTGFERKNLKLRVEKPLVKKRFMREWLKTQTGCGIVYCATRRQTEEVYETLKNWGYNVCRYHAGLSFEERQENQENFTRGIVQIMVATNAFGMGIDKSDVRFILHYSLPLDIEGYYQEAGRAGRDGEVSQCLLLFDRQDVIQLRQLLVYSNEQQKGNAEEKKLRLEKAYERLRKMENYCFTKKCLHKYLLEYFGQLAKENCNNCTNCLHTPDIFERFLK